MVISATFGPVGYVVLSQYNGIAHSMDFPVFYSFHVFLNSTSGFFFISSVQQVYFYIS